MPTAPAARVAPPGARPRTTPAQTGGSTTVQIDPVRLLKKYRWVLAATVVAGAVIGAGAHYLLLHVYPIYKSSAIFEIEAPKTEATEAFQVPDENELERFMKTQALAMTSDRVLMSFLDNTDPTIMMQEASNWTSKFMSRGKFDKVEAFEDLQDIVRANVIPETQYIELSVRTQDPGDAAYLCGRIREFYLADLGDREKSDNSRQLTAVVKQIEDLDEQIERLKNQREEIIRSKGIQSAQERANAKYQEIQLVNTALAEILVERDAALETLSRYEQMLNAPGGVVYPDDIRVAIEAIPTIQLLVQSISQSEAQIRMLQNQGIGEQNLTMRNLRASLEAQKAQLDAQREIELQKYFSGQLESTRAMIASYNRQEVELNKRKDELSKELNELTTIIREIEDMNDTLAGLKERKMELETEQANLLALQSMAETRDEAQRRLFLSRVTVVQRETIPEIPVFPDLKLMIPAGVFVVGGIVGVIIVLREILDQRIKGASDVALIPRTRVLGVIPDASDDPSRPKAIETAFRDQPTGVLAEHYRVLRAQLLPRLQQSGHRSLLIVGGMPDSGASSTAINLALAFAASDKKALLIDANLRRPSIHQTLARSEQPGLCDVLAGSVSLENAVQQTDNANLDVLTVGSRANRIFEALASEAFARLLAEAGADYDLVIVDTSPAIVSGDAMALANRCDAAMLVVRAMHEKRGMVARLRGEFEEARGEFLGVVINGVRHAAGGYLRQNLQTQHRYQTKDA